MAGFVALIAWMPLLPGASRTTLSVAQIEDAKSGATIDAGTQPLKGIARRKQLKCAECGLIESIREVETGPETASSIPTGGPVVENRNRTPVRSAGRQITIRLQDGSSRVIIDANPGRLRLGERVNVIDGLAGPGA